MTLKQRRPTRAWSRRPHFAPRQKLTAQALNAALDDQIARQALLNRALHGNGVVFGLPVALKDPDLAVGCGLALDRHGRTLYWDGGEVGIGDIAGDPPASSGEYTLAIHYAERSEGERDGCWPCGSEAEWVEQGVLFTLRPGCIPLERCCPEKPPRARSVTFDDFVCQRTGAQEGPVRRAPDLDWSCAPPGALCDSHCHWRYDAAAGVDIASVTVRDLADNDGTCTIWAFADPIDPCDVRPFAARTPLLLDLLRGCPPQIEIFSWLDWTRDYSGLVTWQDFVGLFDDNNGLKISFTKPIRRSTLHPGSISLTVITRDRNDDYLTPRQIPLDPEKPIEFLDTDPDYVSQIRLNLYEHWKQNHLRGNYGSLYFEGGQIELAIRGQLLRDACENMLDARVRDTTPVDWANRRIGDDFVAVFNVASGARPTHQLEHSPRADARQVAGGPVSQPTSGE